MWLAQKQMNGKKSPFLHWQEIWEENPGVLLRSSVFDYDFIPKQVFHPLGLMHGQVRLQYVSQVPVIGQAHDLLTAKWSPKYFCT